MQNYFLYVRKSTDVEDKQVRSIEDQLAVLNKLAKEENLNVVQEFTERQSAKTPGRSVFTEMLSRIERGEAQGIICWKLDRLARNPVDGGQISWFLQRGVLQHIRTFEKSYYPNDNVVMMSVEFGMANQFVLDLSVNTKRGLMEKVRRGEYPSHAPIGYLNDIRNKSVIVDKKRSKLVVQAFELYSQNTSTFEDIANFLAKGGVTTSGGRPIKRDQVSYLLCNPFYYGYCRYNGEVYEGKHSGIVPKKLFDKVQVVLKSRSKPKKSKFNPKALCSLIHCGECGRMITATTHVKKSGLVFSYYRCTKRNTNCSQPHIRETELISQLDFLLAQYTLPENWAGELLKLAEKDCQESVSVNSVYAKELRAKVEELDTRLKRLLNMYLDQDIEQEKYRPEKAKLLSEKRSLTEQITRMERTLNSWFEPYQNWIKDAQDIDKIAISPSLESKKRSLQKIFGSNLVLSEQKVSGTPANPWSALLETKQKTPSFERCPLLARELGIEPRTITLTACRSTAELLPNEL